MAGCPIDRVYWIGGPPDAGKTTVAGLLGEWFDLAVYHQDRHEMEHIRRAEPIRHPRHVAMRARIDDGTFHEAWVVDSAEILAREHRANWAERIDMVCEDLAAFAPGHPIVAEGPGFFPDVLQAMNVPASRAIWLIPTEAFKRASHSRRRKGEHLAQTSDPETAKRHHLERDLLLAAAYRHEVHAAQLPWIDVTGADDAATVAHAVSRHFSLE